MPRLPGRIGKAVEGAESSAFATFKSDIEDKIAATRTIIAEIRANLSESTLKMNGDKIQEILSSVSALFSINKYTERKEREDILKWISNLDVEEFHQTQLTRAGKIGPGKAGKWIFLEDAYQKWTDSEISSTLWLQGGPGTGKTILTSTVIEACKGKFGKDVIGPVAYFYCSGDPGTAQKSASAEAVLKNILRQLAESFNEGFKLMSAQWDKQQGSRFPKGRLQEDEVMGRINEIMELAQALETIIIIDGLDELVSRDLDYLLGYLHKLSENTKVCLKVFLASRPLEPVQAYAKDGFTITLDKKKTKRDLDLFIEATVEVRLNWREKEDPDLRKDVLETMKIKAQGV